MDSPRTPPTDVEIDVRVLLSSVMRRLPYLIVFVVIVAVIAYVVLSQIAPSYRSEATLLIETGESDLTRPTQSTTNDTSAILDQQAIASQAQLLRSRDLAKAVAVKLNLAARPEFNGEAARKSPFTALLGRLGLVHQPSEASIDDRVLDVFFEKLVVNAVANSRVITVDFSSTDPQLAADAANAVAEEYIAREQAAKQSTTANAAQYLSDQIVDLRQKVEDAEAKVATYRSANDLFDSGGATPATLPQQQLSDLNAQLAGVEADRANAEAKAAQIRLALQSNSVPNLTDVLNSPLIQQLVGQEVALRAQIAQLGATLLPQHPKMVELNAQLADLDKQIANEANKIVQSLEAEASLAASREADINQSLDKLKAAAATADDASVKLRALDREAAADRDLLDSYLRSYREAVAREQTDYAPADARIVSRATMSIDPDFPKKLPMTTAATVAALLLAIAFVLLRELASGRPMRAVEPAAQPMPVVPDSSPVSGHARWADERSLRHAMPPEPTLVPEIVDHVEESLAAIARQIADSGEKRVLVTLAEGSDDEGRPLGAVALARALARSDARVVLIDFRGDGADAASMGDGREPAGFADLFDGEASFAQAIFRDRKSRAHFIPAGRKLLSPNMLDAEHLETVLSALTLTYDYVLLDAGDDMIALLGPGSGIAMVVSEFASADPRTARAFDRVTAVADVPVLLLLVDPAAPRPSPGSGEPADAERASAGEAA